MSITAIDAWRRPGCGSRCFPRWHDLGAHEAFGFRLGVLAATPPPRIVRSGALTVDLEHETALLGDAVIPFSLREWQTLAYLAARPGRNTTAAELGARAYGAAYSEHVARVVLSRVRTALGTARGVIESAGPGRGVRFRVDPPVGDPPTLPYTGPYTHGRGGRGQAPPTWARRHRACTCCGRADKPHYGGGRCSRCYVSPSRTPHRAPCQAPPAEGGAP